MRYSMEKQMIAIVRAVMRRRQAGRKSLIAQMRAQDALYKAFGAPLGASFRARQIWLLCATGTTRN